MNTKKQRISEDLKKMSYMMGFDAAKTPTENKVITENLLTIPEKNTNVKDLVENAIIRTLIRGTKYAKNTGRLLKGAKGIFGPMKNLKGAVARKGGEKLMANMSKASRDKLVVALKSQGATQANLSTKLIQNMDSPAVLKILKGESRLSKQLQNNLYYYYKANPKLARNLPKEFQNAIKQGKQTIVPMKVSGTGGKGAAAGGKGAATGGKTIGGRVKDVISQVKAASTSRVVKAPLSIGRRVFNAAKTIFGVVMGWWIVKWAVILGVGWLAFSWVKDWIMGGNIPLTPDQKMEVGLQSAYAAGYFEKVKQGDVKAEAEISIQPNFAEMLAENLVESPSKMTQYVPKYCKSLLDSSMICWAYYNATGKEFLGVVLASEESAVEDDSTGLYTELLPLITPLCFAIIDGTCCNTPDEMQEATGMTGPDEGGVEGEALGQFDNYPCVIATMKKYKGTMKQTSTGTAYVKIVIDGRTAFFLPDGTAQIEDLGGGKNLRGTYSCKGASTVEFEEGKIHESLGSLLNEEEIAFGDMVISVGATDGGGPSYDESSDDSNYASDDAGEETSISKYRNCTTFPLQKFCKGNKVKELQNLLVSAGFSVGPKGVDGKFGPDTLAGVKSAQKGTPYQKDNGVVTEDFFVSLKGGGTVAGETDTKPPTNQEKKDEDVGAEVEITKGNAGSKIAAGDQLVQDTIDGVDVVKGPGGTEYATTDDVEKIKYTKQGNIKTIKTEFQIIKFDKKTGKVKTVKDRRHWWGGKKKRK